MSAVSRFIKTPWRFLLKLKYSMEREIINFAVKNDFFSYFPIQDNKVVMDNVLGKGYGENPKYIAEELLRRGGKQRIIWLANNVKEPFPKGVKPIYRNSIRAFYECATAKAWVFNTRHGKLLKKRKEQVLLQTWHGGVAIKKVEKDAEDKLTEYYVSSAKYDGEAADGILVDGKTNEKLFETSFWLSPNCERLKIGQPRIDFLIRERDNLHLKKQIRDKLHVPQDVFFVLYAPTFRKDHSTRGYISDFPSVKDALKEKFGPVAIAIRMHPNVSQLAKSYLSIDNNLIDATDYADVQELILAADCLISDYSSITYDFALIRKPVFLIMKDVEEYKAERGVYDIFYDQPFKMNYNEEELCEEIRSCSLNQVKEKEDEFYARYPSFNRGNASQQAVDWLFQKGLK